MAKMIKALFIGGPLNGQVLPVISNRYAYQVFPQNSDISAESEIFTYSIEHFAIMNRTITLGCLTDRSEINEDNLFELLVSDKAKEASCRN